jgi:hypothetical protein
VLRVNATPATTMNETSPKTTATFFIKPSSNLY